MKSLISPLLSERLVLALDALEQEGLQAPRLSRMEIIVRNALGVVALLRAGALRQPSSTELEELFRDFVVRCVNRPARIGDAVPGHPSAIKLLGSQDSLNYSTNISKKL